MVKSKPVHGKDAGKQKLPWISIIGAVLFMSFIVAMFLLIPFERAIIAVLGVVLAAAAIVIFFLWKERRLKPLDVIKLVWFDTYRATKQTNFVTPVPLLLKRDFLSSAPPAQIGKATGAKRFPVEWKLFEREMVQHVMRNEGRVDKIKDAIAIMKQVDKKTKKRLSWIWCFKVKPHSVIESEKEALFLVPDTLISPDSRDAAGDLQPWTSIVVKGVLARFGLFYFVWDSNVTLLADILGLETMCVLEILVATLNKISIAARESAKAKESIVDSREMKKEEMEVLGSAST